ncbi:dimethylarginine dimethylaminohydrolase family protein [candidate division KSB1 bacterium]
MQYGCTSEVGAVRSILLKHPKDAFKDQDNVNSQWKDLNFLGCPDFKKACDEYEKFLKFLKEHIPDVHFLPEDFSTGMDSVYVRDSVLITQKGAILCCMGKDLRKGEPAASGKYLESIGIPILGEITGEGRLEGGDIILIDEKTLAVGEGYRTNAAGIKRLRELTRGFIDEIIVVPLPHWNGPGDVFHLMSIISPVDHNIAVVYSRLMPVPFRNFLMSRGIELVEVPDSEFDSMGCNILAVAPGVCVMIAGNPKTKERLEKAGATVFEYEGQEISVKGGGGPTCLTRPLLRE